ncbi:hypothetical protein H1W37_09425 [Stappia taiwanensis]|uniref:Uncharacterized protein n=1 Tax=Stappia taiwanensis TaxID=992267 RepID=A0A838XYM9_9HYPH|nr:hypothetical protein [Stappia taiwanensis]MBA4611870.1 hypothetical protein [Stappia taiwanensis]GGF03437.1 hypothetical protein GCM10007285_33960 [Stappia taiwanensis]
MTGAEPERAPVHRAPATGLTWRFRPGRGSGVLAVVFSQARVPEGRFGLERLFARTRHDCLFLNCPDALWFLECDDQIDAAIEAAIAASQARRVVYHGASKGAHGALLTGLRRRDGAIHAFCPELRLGVPGSQSALYRPQGADPGPDLAALLTAAPTPHPVQVVFGLLDPIDAAGATALAGRQDANPMLHVLRLRSSHAAHDHLYSLNIIRKLITRYDRDLEAMCAERGLIAEDAPADVARFAEVASGLVLGNPDALGEALRDPYARHNPGYALCLATALIAAGRWEEAEARLAEAQALIDVDPVLSGLPKRWRKAVWQTRIDGRQRAGDGAGAECLQRMLMQRFPDGTAD